MIISLFWMLTLLLEKGFGCLEEGRQYRLAHINDSLQ
jgi:hypothetical protein